MPHSGYQSETAANSLTKYYAHPKRKSTGLTSITRNFKREEYICRCCYGTCGDMVLFPSEKPWEESLDLPWRPRLNCDLIILSAIIYAGYLPLPGSSSRLASANSARRRIWWRSLVRHVRYPREQKDRSAFHKLDGTKEISTVLPGK